MQKVLVKVNRSRISIGYLEKVIEPKLKNAGFEMVMAQERIPFPFVKDEYFGFIVFGGDGTFISGARIAHHLGMNVFGFDAGNLGYLCQGSMEQLDQTFASLADGKYHIHEQSVLLASIIRDGKQAFSEMAINDVVISRHDNAHVINLETYIADTFLITYKADGLIIASSLGSTGYSMAAGGPIIQQTLPVNTVTAICPHPIAFRPLVVSEDEAVKVRLVDRHTDMTITFDGRIVHPGLHMDNVIVTAHPRKLNIIKLEHPNNIESISAKLRLTYAPHKEYEVL